jgi:hypothetical protein
VLRGSEKTLFRFRSRLDADVTRIAVTEAPIDALILAAIEEGEGGYALRLHDRRDGAGDDPGAWRSIS